MNYAPHMLSIAESSPRYTRRCGYIDCINDAQARCNGRQWQKCGFEACFKPRLVLSRFQLSLAVLHSFDLTLPMTGNGPHRQVDVGRVVTLASLVVK